MNEVDLAKVVAEYRSAQTEHFKSPKRSTLDKLKRLEERVDRCLASILDKGSLPIEGP